MPDAARTTQVALILLLLATTARSETATTNAATPAVRLPIRAYTILDGLSDDGVLDLWQDSRGYIWVGTISGLGRFDGTRFTTVLDSEGAVTRIAEAPDGALWIGSEGGLFRLDPRAPAGPPAFTRMLERPVQAPHIDGSGDVWVGHRDRLYRLHQSNGRFDTTMEVIAAPFTVSSWREFHRIVSDTER